MFCAEYISFELFFLGAPETTPIAGIRTAHFKLGIRNHSSLYTIIKDQLVCKIF